MGVRSSQTLRIGKISIFLSSKIKYEKGEKGMGKKSD